MSCTFKLVIHPAKEEAGGPIGEVVDEFYGTVNEKNLLGISMFLAEFNNELLAAKAKEKLEELEVVSHVEFTSA